MNVFTIKIGTNTNGKRYICMWNNQKINKKYYYDFELIFPIMGISYEDYLFLPEGKYIYSEIEKKYILATEPEKKLIIIENRKENL